MKTISAEIVADSIDPRGNRITSVLLTYPRFIHSELLTHRMFSRNSASSRAIPFERMVKMVQGDPFIPIAVQRDHKGMQGTQYLDETQYDCFKMEWLAARDSAIKHAKWLNTESFTTKQLCNRLLEPFMWHTTLCTFTESENFFKLRMPCYELENNQGNIEYCKSKKDWLLSYSSEVYGMNIPKTNLDWLKTNKSGAEIHIQALAEAMWDEFQESKPKLLKAGEYHLPFIEITDIRNATGKQGIQLDIYLKRGTDVEKLVAYIKFSQSANQKDAILVVR